MWSSSATDSRELRDAYHRSLELGSEMKDEEIFKEGHKCTDVLCCMWFGVCMVLFLSVNAFAMKWGDLGKISNGVDLEGRVCGVSQNVTDKPFLYFCPDEAFDSNLSDLQINVDKGVCLQTCPSGKDEMIPARVPGCKSVPKAYNSTEWVLGELSPFCYPQGKEANTEAVNAVRETQTRQLAREIMNAAAKESRNWPVLLTVTVASILMGYLYLFLLRHAAGVMIWGATGILVVLLLGTGVAMWVESDKMGKMLNQELTDIDLNDSGHIWAHIIGVGLWVLAALVVLMVGTCVKSVSTSISAVQAGSDVMFHMPMMLFAPMAKGMAKAILVLVCVLGFVKLFCTGEVVPGSTSRDRLWDFGAHQYFFMLFYIFCSVWLSGFVTALYQFSIAYSVTKYYHTEPEHYDDDDRDVGMFVVCEGVGMGIMKHTGSLAFGAALMSVTRFAYYISEWVDRANKDGHTNPVINCMLGACLCCCVCCETPLKFVNQQVYIDMAVTSQNFCESIKSVMHIMIDFGTPIAILNGATVIFQMVGVVLITAVSGLLADLLFFHFEYDEPTIGAIICCVIAFTVAYSFMSIFDVTTDTLLYCYALDRNRRNHALTCPEEMRKLFETVEKERAMAHEQDFDRRIM